MLFRSAISQSIRDIRSSSMSKSEIQDLPSLINCACLIKVPITKDYKNYSTSGPLAVCHLETSQVHSADNGRSVFL